MNKFNNMQFNKKTEGITSPESFQEEYIWSS